MKQFCLYLFLIISASTIAQINPIQNHDFSNWFWTDNQDTLYLPNGGILNHDSLYLPNDWTVGYRDFVDESIQSIDINPDLYAFIDLARIKHTFFNYAPHTDINQGFLKMVPDHDNYPYYYDFCFDPYAYQKIPFLADSINLNFDYYFRVNYVQWFAPGTQPQIIIEEYDNTLNEYVEKMVWLADTSAAFQNDSLNVNLNITGITDSLKIILSLIGYDQNQDYVIYDNVVVSYDTIAIDTTNIDTTTNIINYEANSFAISPNPVGEILIINSNNINPNTTAKIFDINGKMVIEKPLTNQALNVNQLNAGIYFIALNINGKSKVQKFYKR